MDFFVARDEANYFFAFAIFINDDNLISWQKIIQNNKHKLICKSIHFLNDISFKKFWVIIKLKWSTLRTTRSSWMRRRRRSVVDWRVSGSTRMSRLVRVAVRRSVTRRTRPLIGVSVEFRRRHRRLGNEDLARVVVRPSERRCHHWRAGKLTTSRAATKNDFFNETFNKFKSFGL